MMNQFHFSTNTKRLPLFGLGGLAGVAGINRINDYLIGHPEKAALLIVTELCSMGLQLEMESISGIVGATSFGDGSGAVLLVGNEHPLSKNAPFEILASESFFYPGTERIMEDEVIDIGTQIILSDNVAMLVKNHTGKDVDEFLRKNKITRNDIGHYIIHPEGPKILEAFSETMNIDKKRLELSWESLAKFGNTSAVSVIDILERTIKNSNITSGHFGLMMAMGPALSLELSLMKKR
jgi:alkylresorcinol/alkylpyrone synthase